MTAPVALQSSLHHVRLEFFWLGDRYHHQIVTGDCIVAKSIEGDSTDAWPASPPIQQLSLELIQDEPCILGVGAAGRGHWSISVRLIESESQVSFEFDLACRSKETPESLVSTYDPCDGGVAFESLAETLITLDPKGNVEVRPQSETSQMTRQWKYTLTVDPAPQLPAAHE